MSGAKSAALDWRVNRLLQPRPGRGTLGCRRTRPLGKIEGVARLIQTAFRNLGRWPLSEPLRMGRAVRLLDNAQLVRYGESVPPGPLYQFRVRGSPCRASLATASLSLADGSLHSAAVRSIAFRPHRPGFVNPPSVLSVFPSRNRFT